jgi:hypothetical protein
MFLLEHVRRFKLWWKDSKLDGQVIGLWWESKIILNSGERTERKEVEEEDENRTARKYISELKKKMLKLKGQFIVEEGNNVKINYEGIASSPEFEEFIEFTKGLRDIRLGSLKDFEKKAFFLNLYNILSLHGFVNQSNRNSMTMIHKLPFFALTSYLVEDYILSLNDIEHGILRGNRCGPVPLCSQQFPEGDERIASLTLPLDPRIHFAINCGSKSCPPIAIFDMESEEQLNKQLDMAARSFLRNDVEIIDNEKEKKLSVTSIFTYYRHDFGETDQEIINWIMTHADKDLSGKIKGIVDANGSKVQIHYKDWNWETNSL